MDASLLGSSLRTSFKPGAVCSTSHSENREENLDPSKINDSLKHRLTEKCVCELGQRGGW